MSELPEGFFTGMFIRIQRGGVGVSVDVARCTDAELEAYFEGNDAADRWAIALAKWIRDNVAMEDAAEESHSQ